MSDEDLVVNRWRRYGKDRLYVETTDGAKVGFWDFVTETAHPETADCESALLEAVANWKSVTGTSEAGAAAGVPAREGPTAPPASMADGPVAPEPLTHGGDASLAVPVLDIPADPVRPWVDLAANRAGAEAREQARAARDAAPVRTVLARVLGVHTNERAWRIGADGEE
ncbi:MAG: hypothetical protein ACXVHI_08580, partial [Frankiaceae bacterium]